MAGEVGAAGTARAATWCCGRPPSWRAVIDANGVTNLLVAGLDGGEVEDDDDAAVLHGVADELVQPDDAELLQLPPQHPARTVSALCGPPHATWGGGGGGEGADPTAGGGAMRRSAPAPCPSSS